MKEVMRESWEKGYVVRTEVNSMPQTVIGQPSGPDTVLGVAGSATNRKE